MSSVAFLWVAFVGPALGWAAFFELLFQCVFVAHQGCHTHLLGMKCCVLWLLIIPPFHRAWIAKLGSSDQTSQWLLFASVYKLWSRERMEMCLCTCAEILIINVWVWGKEVMWLVWCYPLLSPIPALSGCQDVRFRLFFHTDSWSVGGHVWGHSVCNPDKINHSRPNGRSVQPGCVCF